MKALFPILVCAGLFAPGRFTPGLFAHGQVNEGELQLKMTDPSGLASKPQNLNNVLNVLDFGGQFSGNAIGPPRSDAARLTTTF